MSNIEYQNVILAGLLHDIGKFLQRSEYYEGYEFDEVDRNNFLKEIDGKQSHYHALYSYEFLLNEFPWPDFINDDRKEKISEYYSRKRDWY